VWLYKTADRWTSGIPDLILCIEGKFYAIELKVGKNKPTRIQAHALEKIKSAGGYSAVCRSIDEVKDFLTTAGKEKVMNQFLKLKTVADIVFAEVDMSSDDYFEIARNAQAIINVGQNRVKRPAYFKCKDLYEVFTKNKQFSAYPDSSQFKKAQAFRFGNLKEFKVWKTVFDLICKIEFCGEILDITDGADHYYNPQICGKPVWHKDQPVLLIQGKHIFIRLAKA